MVATSEQIRRALRERVRGEVLTDDQALSRYATDQSMYLVRPLAVAFPANVGDVVAIVRYAREEGIPLTARGGGSGTAGAALGRGILVAWRRDGPMNRVLGYEEAGAEPRVTVEPGLLHNDLQAFLRERGLYLPADPSSGAICLLGGNIATKASGPHALKHGSIDRYLRRLQFVTAEGEVVDTADEATIPTRIGRGIAALAADLLADEATVRRLAARQDRKLASGYNLFTFLRQRTLGEWTAQLLVGSVGTLGIVTQATLRAQPYIEGKATTLLYFRSLDEAGEAVQHIKALGVAAIEIMNHRTIAIVQERRKDLEAPEGESHMLLVEYEGPERAEQVAAVERLVASQGYALAAPMETVEGEAEQERLWKMRKALLPTVRNYRADRLALSVVNDVGVPEEHLAAFIRDVEAIFARHDLVAAVYGHAGSGNLHLRPLFDAADPGLLSLLREVADEVYAAVLCHDGTITAEHGMGRLRTPYLAREWGESIMGYMRRVKAAFEPADLLNPEAMFSERALTGDMRIVAAEG